MMHTGWVGMGLLLLLLLLGAAAEAALLLPGRPDRNDFAGMARWLVSGNSWGVLSTVSVHLQGMPFGNIASFSDGPPGNSTGTPYFYLTKLDPTAYDLSKNPRCSLSLSEEPLGTCGNKDAENPSCAKLTLSGQVEEIQTDKERGFAAEALFSKHPEMRSWPAHHNFRFYKFIIEDIFLIDWFGGPKPLTVSDYYWNNHISTFLLDGLAQ
ncbi:hypothetical protein O6H91_20G039600 [Diphasiastrum complanatum]|uniref:Uncharacterized protein n=1 Tax=Diphasiastrum complanatum TaxID=34168 RepID=A0ACC2APD4_DIPCM|nr:hypothetical protein O6H91_20G039600 [Diphasiastrum complanatum]